MLTGFCRRHLWCSCWIRRSGSVYGFPIRLGRPLLCFRYVSAFQMPLVCCADAWILKLNPPRLLQIIHLPIKAMRLVTDPLVDFAVFLFHRFVVPPLLDVVKGSVNLSLLFVQTMLGKEMANRVSEASNTLVSLFCLFSLAHRLTATSVRPVESLPPRPSRAPLVPFVVVEPHCGARRGPRPPIPRLRSASRTAL